MVLMALAVIFAVVGWFSLGNDDDSAAEPAATTTEETVAAPAATTTAAVATDADVLGSAAADQDAGTTDEETTTVADPVGVRVLNGTGVAGLAAGTAEQVAAGGWQVIETGNYSGPAVGSTTVFYDSDSDQQAQADQIAEALGVAPAEPKLATFTADQSGIVVVVTG